MKTETPIVELAQVDVDIDAKPVLSGIELTIGPGQHLGIVGHNGSGKSTLLALIAGLRWPAPGRGRRRYDFGDGPEHDAVTARQRIALFGHELQDLYRRRHWNFRVRDTVLSGVMRSDIPQRNPSAAAIAAADALLAAMDLSPLGDRRLLELSRGQQRRVLIARSLAFEPALLVLDEPMSGLDASAAAALETMLEEVAKQTTLVVSAHRADQLPRLVTQTVTLAGGRIVSQDIVADRTVPAERPVADAPAAADERSPAGVPAGSGGRRALIELIDASAWLGEREILHRANWRLEPGDHWLVTGQNGAGKSTFLRLLNAEIRPARGGTVRWPGLGDPANVWQLRRAVALVSAELQARYLYPSTVFETVASGFDASIGLMRPLDGDEKEQVLRLLEAFELDGFADRPLTALSYGQRHRALLARTLATEPRVLLLDEPWEGLDDATRHLVSAELINRLARGMQIVCVSHLGPGSLPLNRHLTIAGGRLVSDAGERAERRENSSSARRRAPMSPRH